MMELSPKRYFVISPSDFCAARCILLSKTNPMRIVGSRIRTKELGIVKLYWASNVLTFFDEHICGDNNHVVVRGIGTCN